MLDRKNAYQHFAAAMGKVMDRQDPEEMAEKLFNLEALAKNHPDLETRKLASVWAAKLAAFAGFVEK